MTYDRAKYHIEGDFPSDLPDTQAFVHIGMFLGWAAEKGLLNLEFKSDFGDEIRLFETRKLSCGRFFQLVGGVLADDMLSDAGNGFAENYYLKTYFADYVALFSEYPTAYHVADTPENLDRIKQRLDNRFSEWQAGL